MKWLLSADSPCSCLMKAPPDDTQERGIRAEPAEHLLLLRFCRTGTRWGGQSVHCRGEISVHRIHLHWSVVDYFQVPNLLLFVSGHKHSLGREGDVYLPTGLWSRRKALACQPLYGMTSVNSEYKPARRMCPFLFRIQKWSVDWWVLNTFITKWLGCSIHFHLWSHCKFFCTII